MTQPQNSPPPADQPHIKVHFELQPGPDGYPWVKCTLQVGLASFAFVATESQSEQLGPILGQGFAEGAAAARRNRLGLILPGQGDAPSTNGQLLVNGARPA